MFDIGKVVLILGVHVFYAKDLYALFNIFLKLHTANDIS